MKYRVTGGPEGDRGIDDGGRRYEPGDVIEMTQAKAQWLVDKGLLEADAKPTGKTKPAPAPAPAQVDDLTDDTDDLSEEFD